MNHAHEEQGNNTKVIKRPHPPTHHPQNAQENHTFFTIGTTNSGGVIK